MIGHLNWCRDDDPGRAPGPRPICRLFPDVRPPKPESCCRQPLFLPVTYVSKIENERFDFGDYPSEDLIRKIAAALEADEHELLTLPERIPEEIKKRILEHPEVLRKIAQLDDETLNNMLKDLDK